MAQTQFPYLVLYDGVCPFCNRAVRTIIASDRTGILRFAPLQSQHGITLSERFPDLRIHDSVALLEFGQANGTRVFVRSTAFLRIASLLGGWWRMVLAFYVLPRPLRDFVYDLFARVRYKLFGKYEQCVIPPVEIRSRFIDLAEQTS